MSRTQFGNGAKSRQSIHATNSIRAGRRARQTIVVFGVSGCGKSTIGRLLAAARGAVFLEGDLYHSPVAIVRMRAGLALSDGDRWPWLDRIARALTIRGRYGRAVVVACSALKRAYRARLARRTGGDVVFVHLALDPHRLELRLNARRHHFMPPALLESQLATLEPLASGEAGTTISAEGPAGRAVADIQRWLAHRNPAPQRTMKKDGRSHPFRADTTRLRL